MHRLSIVKGSPSLASTYCTSCSTSGSAEVAIPLTTRWMLLEKMKSIQELFVQNCESKFSAAWRRGRSESPPTQVYPLAEKIEQAAVQI
jgi:hypothetical protein